jgi:hypothetical protein
MSDLFGNVANNANSLKNIDLSQALKRGGTFKTVDGTFVQINKGEGNKIYVSIATDSTANSPTKDVALKDRTARQTTSEDFSSLKNVQKRLFTSPEQVKKWLKEQHISSLKGKILDSVQPQKSESSSAIQFPRINVDDPIWATKAMETTPGDQKKIANWIEQVEAMQSKISRAKPQEKIGCGRTCIAESYVKTFFPNLEEQKYKSKVAEIEQMLAQGGSDQVDHRTFTTGLYGDQNFFQQTAGPLRELITSAIERSELNLGDGAATQELFEKIVKFSSVARGAVAMVAEPQGKDVKNFGLPITNFTLGEPFNKAFTKLQIAFARWLASNEYPTLPNDCQTLQLKQLYNSEMAYINALGNEVLQHGFITHSYLNMMLRGSDIFRECIGEARRLKENPDDPEALAAFTQAMKKFMYTWSQSAICYRGQAAMLMMLVDSMAKYAGVQLKRPEVPENAQEMMQQIVNRAGEEIKTLEAKIQKGLSDQEQAEIQSLDAEIKSLKEKDNELFEEVKPFFTREFEIPKEIDTLRKSLSEGKENALIEEKIAPLQKEYEKILALRTQRYDIIHKRENCEKRKRELLIETAEKQLKTLQDIKPTAER